MKEKGIEVREDIYIYIYIYRLYKIYVTSMEENRIEVREDIYIYIL